MSSCETMGCWRRSLRRTGVVVAGGALLLATVCVGAPPPTNGLAKDAIAAVEAFSTAIGRGDRTAARAVLMPDVLIFESGGSEESAADYAAHHLAADIMFMAHMKREVQSRQSGGDSTTQWVATVARIQGEYEGKAIDLDTTETAVLTSSGGAWRIAHIHWSSAPHRTGATSKAK